LLSSTLQKVHHFVFWLPSFKENHHFRTSLNSIAYDSFILSSTPTTPKYQSTWISHQ
jgi:hypothetical protein